jgi:transcriptional regulator with XRE-family HTH domain
MLNSSSPLALLDMAAFPERLRDLRQQRQLTQVRVAELIGVGIRVYHRWENGDATPHFDALLRLADVLGVSLDALVGREPLKPEQKIHNHELHRLYQQVDALSDEDQQALIVLLDSLVKRSKVKRAMEEERPARARRRA